MKKRKSGLTSTLKHVISGRAGSSPFEKSKRVRLSRDDMRREIEEAQAKKNRESAALRSQIRMALDLSESHLTENQQLDDILNYDAGFDDSPTGNFQAEAHARGFGGEESGDDDGHEWLDEDPQSDSPPELSRGHWGTLLKLMQKTRHARDPDRRRRRLRGLTESWESAFPALIRPLLDLRYEQHRRRMELIATNAPSRINADSREGEEPVDSPAPGDLPGAAQVYDIRVLSLEYSATPQTRRIVQNVGESLNACLVKAGLFPATPRVPTLAFSIDMLEFYRNLRSRAPATGIEPFIRAACCLQTMEYASGIQENFSWAFDYYLRTLAGIQELADAALEGPGSLDHDCPACGYQLPNEPYLTPARMHAIDGGNSFKRVAAAGRCDERCYKSRLFLSRTTVDAFRKDLPASTTAANSQPTAPRPSTLAANDKNGVSPDFAMPVISDEEGFNIPEDGDARCGTNWLAANGKEMKSKIFEQTGLFVCLCRHGIPEILVEMVRSGELAYPLSCISEIIKRFGVDQAFGYDLGCLLQSTVRNSALAQDAEKNRLSYFVDGFHGSAHKRCCQLQWMGLYRPDSGVGNEDFAGCERFFSQANRAAPTSRYASNYRWMQAIHLTSSQLSTDRYANLGLFELNNLKQALFEIRDNQAWLDRYESRQKFTAIDFQRWLAEEQKFHAETRKKESWDLSCKVEYVLALEKFAEASRKYDVLINDSSWVSTFTPATISRPVDSTSTDGPRVFSAEALNDARVRSVEKARRDKLQVLELAQKAVFHAERVLGVDARWKPEDEEYQEVLDYIKHRKFARAVDVLEGAIVSRDSEYWKANLSQTNYKSRRHIAASIIRRNGALYSAFKTYNELAPLQKPPRPILLPKEVLEQKDLSTLDLLKTSRHDILAKEWTKPENRLAVSRWLKIQCSQAELARISVEVPRLQAWVDFDDQRRLSAVEKTRYEDPALSLFIGVQWRARQQVNDRIRVHLQRIYQHKDYTGPRPLYGAFGAVDADADDDDDDDRREDLQPATAEEEDEMIRLGNVLESSL